MAERTNNFDLKLLTTSKEVGLRRLRSYAASLGGGAQIYNSFEDLRRHLETTAVGRHQSIVLHDGTVPLTPAATAELHKMARVFVLQRPGDAGSHLVPQDGAACWDTESYLQCSLGAFLESPVVRMSMAQVCKDGHPFHLEHLLRWGHAAQTWHAGGPTSVADASLAFVRSLNLTGEGRRLTEMFSHFLQANVDHLGLQKDAVTFGSDGLLILVVAKCRVKPGMSIREIAYELRVQDFPMAIANRLGDGQVEIAGLYYPFQQAQVLAERIVMVFNRGVAAEAEQASPAPLPALNKAG